MGDAMHAMLPNRGMGGNQSMRDTATALPLLQRLAEIKDAAGEISENAIASACKEFEDEMIPRGMEWVQKSGGSKIVVRAVKLYIHHTLDVSGQKKKRSFANVVIAIRFINVKGEDLFLHCGIYSQFGVCLD